MELTLKRLLEQAEFTQTRKGGYDQGEVDEFLDRAVAMATKVEAKLTETLAQAPAAPAAATPAGPSAAEVEAEVERRVAARLAESPAPTGPSEQQVAEEVSRTIVLAQRTADAVTAEAREDAAKLVAEATERAQEIDAEAAARAASARADLEAATAADRAAARERLAAEIGELESVREALRSDATVLERHVEEQRSQLRSTLGELQRLLDDPAGFRLAPAPALLDPEVPELAAEPVAPAPEPEPEPVVAAPAIEPEPEPVRPAPPAQTAVVIEDAGPGPDAGAAPSLSFADVDHAAPGLHEGLDTGPPTAPVSAVDLGLGGPAPTPRGRADASAGAGEEDAFLAELRKAMADDEPLGPRDHAEQAPTGILDDDDDRRGWRRGKRR